MRVPAFASGPKAANRSLYIVRNSSRARSHYTYIYIHTDIRITLVAPEWRVCARTTQWHQLAAVHSPRALHTPAQCLTRIFRWFAHGRGFQLSVAALRGGTDIDNAISMHARQVRHLCVCMCVGVCARDSQSSGNGEILRRREQWPGSRVPSGRLWYKRIDFFFLFFFIVLCS